MFRKSVLFALLITLFMFSLVVSAEEHRLGTWVDEVIMTEEPSAATAITRLQVGDIDLYADTVSDAEAFQNVRADGDLDYYRAFGSYSELTFNTVGPYFEDGRLNPFNNKRIREAFNYLIDRDYIAQELYGGLAVPKYTLLNSSFVDYSRVVEKARELELQYAPDFDRAADIIGEEMENMGAQLVDGLWHYDGEPLEVLFLIRNEDERLDVGDYIASLVEDLGFEVQRDYRSGAEATPVWLTGDPHQGNFHLYTGGWIAPVVYRDQGHIFNQMYTRHTMQFPLFQALEPIPELEELSDKLYRKEFNTMEERAALYERALELAFKDSPRIFLVDIASFVPRKADISVASDLAGHVAGTALWPSTLRRGDEVGGTVRIAMPQVLVEPWNPVAGSNWTFDQMPIRATMDRGIIVDPFTGLHWAHRVERAEVYVKEGLPVSKTLDWVDLEFLPEVEVPADAWTDWDPVNQRFVTVEEKYPEGVTVNRKNVVYFPEDFYEKAKWHDGSPVSLGDILFWFILEFDRGSEESDIYDESAVSSLNTLRNHFRGLRIVQEDPLVLEYYSDLWYLDAEQNTTALFPAQFNYGKAPWHTLSVGMLAEIAEELAFSSSKADKINAEHLGLHSGPSLEILAKHLDVAQAAGFLPYSAFLGDYISAEEIAERYANAQQWYEDKGHFWIGDGPMYLERAYPIEKTVHLKRNPYYSEPADKWAMFDEPRIADVAVSGANRVSIGDEATFNVEVTFQGEPYPLEHITEVSYLVLDAQNNVAFSGEGVGVEDGLFEIVLTEEETNALTVGSNTLEVIVLPVLVGGASFGQQTFVTLP